VVGDERQPWHVLGHVLGQQHPCDPCARFLGHVGARVAALRIAAAALRLAARLARAYAKEPQRIAGEARVRARGGRPARREIGLGLREILLDAVEQGVALVVRWRLHQFDGARGGRFHSDGEQCAHVFAHALELIRAVTRRGIGRSVVCVLGDVCHLGMPLRSRGAMRPGCSHCFRSHEGSGAPRNAGACEAPWSGGEPPRRACEARRVSLRSETRASRRSAAAFFGPGPRFRPRACFCAAVSQLLAGGP